MIAEIEDKLIYWGDCLRSKFVAEGRVRCALNTDGLPRATGLKSSGLAYVCGVELDRLTAAVDAAVSAVVLPVSKGGLGEKAGEDLRKLARVRYLVSPALTIEQQLKRMRCKTQKTYFIKLHQLHCFVESYLAKGI